VLFSEVTLFIMFVVSTGVSLSAYHCGSNGLSLPDSLCGSSLLILSFFSRFSVFPFFFLLSCFVFQSLNVTQHKSTVIPDAVPEAITSVTIKNRTSLMPWSKFDHMLAVSFTGG